MASRSTAASDVTKLLKGRQLSPAQVKGLAEQVASLQDLLEIYKLRHIGIPVPDGVALAGRAPREQLSKVIELAESELLQNLHVFPVGIPVPNELLVEIEYQARP
jgi:hypothetical protein